MERVKIMELSDYMTVRDVMAYLKITKNGVGIVSKNQQWRTLKVGHSRLYLREDVENTPLKRRGRPKKQKNTPLER